MINVLGDALAAGIMAHICRKDFAPDTDAEVRAVPPPSPASQRPWRGGPGGMGTNFPLTSWGAIRQSLQPLASVSHLVPGDSLLSQLVVEHPPRLALL